MKRFGYLLTMVCAAWLGACGDQAAIKALQESTALLTQKATGLGDEIAGLSKEFDGCQAELNKVLKKKAPEAEEMKFELPALAEGTPTKASLETYKTALTELVAKQEAKLAELKSAGETCTTELAAAKEKAAVAVKKVVAKPEAAPTVKPVAVQKAEEAGTATKGVKSRYKKR